MTAGDSLKLQRGRLAQLRQFIVLDVVVTFISAAAMAVMSVVFIDNVWIPVAALVVISGGATMAMGLRPLVHGDVSSAVMWVAAGNWGVAVTAAAIAPHSWPIQSLAALVPAVVAVPYVSRARYRLILGVSVVASVSAATLGLFQDFTGMTEGLPGWILPTVLVAFMPSMAALITQAGSGAATILRELLDESLAANEQLRRSEAALEIHAELLRQSRSRVVAAGDRERRRIERRLHDGAQQHLAALGLQISLARTQCLDDSAAAQATLDKMRGNVRRTQDELRTLVRGIYPPVLTQHGLASAVRAAVTQIEGPLRDEIEDVGRHDSGVEAALYFCCIEAMQNIMKHTPADTVVTVTLRIDHEDGDVLLSIVDDGPGFLVDPHDGAGLTDLADRIGAVGGDLEISSSPGGGTRVEARVAQAQSNVMPSTR